MDNAAEGAGAEGGVLASVDAFQRLLDFAYLNKDSPQSFYLPDDGLEELSDCFAVVEGVRLPLHSQVLGTQCAVLRDLFRSQKAGITSNEVRGGGWGWGHANNQ